MNKLTAILISVLILTMGLTAMSFAQGARITRWGDNAVGAYSIDVDDFPLVNPDIHQEECNSRDMNISFAVVIDWFGDYSSYGGGSARIDWNKARELYADGHEIGNHTWEHSVINGWDATDYERNVDDANEKIEREIGVRPYYFVYPDDVFNNTSNNYIRDNGFIMATAGAQEEDNPQTVNPYDIDDCIEAGFRCMNDVSASQEVAFFNDYIDEIIDDGGWGVRMMHGIDDGDWGDVNEASFTTHLDYVQAKRESGDIWMETCSNVARYIKERETVSISVSSDNNTMDITFNMNGLDTAVYNCYLTIMAKAPSGYTNIGITQGSGTDTIGFSEQAGDSIMFNAVPGNGVVHIHNNYVSGVKEYRSASSVSNLRLTSHPNPCARQLQIQYQVPDYAKNQSIKVSVYNTKGALVRKMTGDVTGMLTWDLADQHNRAVPNGCYIIKVETGGMVQSNKIFVMR